MHSVEISVLKASFAASSGQLEFVIHTAPTQPSHHARQQSTIIKRSGAVRSRNRPLSVHLNGNGFGTVSSQSSFASISSVSSASSSTSSSSASDNGILARIVRNEQQVLWLRNQLLTSFPDKVLPPLEPYSLVYASCKNMGKDGESESNSGGIFAARHDDGSPVRVLSDDMIIERVKLRAERFLRSVIKCQACNSHPATMRFLSRTMAEKDGVVSSGNAKPSKMAAATANGSVASPHAYLAYRLGTGSSNGGVAAMLFGTASAKRIPEYIGLIVTPAIAANAAKLDRPAVQQSFEPVPPSRVRAASVIVDAPALHNQYSNGHQRHSIISMSGSIDDSAIFQQQQKQQQQHESSLTARDAVEDVITSAMAWEDGLERAFAALFSMISRRDALSCHLDKLADFIVPALHSRHKLGSISATDAVTTGRDARHLQFDGQLERLIQPICATVKAMDKSTEFLEYRVLDVFMDALAQFDGLRVLIENRNAIANQTNTALVDHQATVDAMDKLAQKMGYNNAHDLNLELTPVQPTNSRTLRTAAPLRPQSPSQLPSPRPSVSSPSLMSPISSPSIVINSASGSTIPSKPPSLPTLPSMQHRPQPQRSNRMSRIAPMSPPAVAMVRVSASADSVAFPSLPSPSIVTSTRTSSTSPVTQQPPASILSPFPSLNVSLPPLTTTPSSSSYKMDSSAPSSPSQLSAPQLPRSRRGSRSGSITSISPGTLYMAQEKVDVAFMNVQRQVQQLCSRDKLVQSEYRRIQQAVGNDIRLAIRDYTNAAVDNERNLLDTLRAARAAFRPV
ncbi:hypothetical protein GQ42DRAFT_20760 [Ramicandelaber brevisporus]|nr:hypothetical protein GQ42DRAFT_20760 [Ramicandelaber brevisporus]